MLNRVCFNWFLVLLHTAIQFEEDLLDDEDEEEERTGGAEEEGQDGYDSHVAVRTGRVSVEVRKHWSFDVVMYNVLPCHVMVTWGK